MIDIDKIEAAAKAANRDGSTMGDIELHWLEANPATVLEMVSMIRKRDVVLKQALSAFESSKGDSREKYAAIAAIKGVLNERSD
jgi:hypothetical protein